jgi:hypothetical protein
MASQEATTADISSKTKLKQLLKMPGLSSEIDSKFSFESSPLLTAQLRTLQQSKAEELEGEAKSLFACDINHSAGDEFLQVYGTLPTLYIRDGYDELYEDIQRLWKEPTTREVILLGNAGSGKSWYQTYVIRRLLRLQLEEGGYKDDDDYDFIFRQVGKEMYLIDLKECFGYTINSWDRETMTKLKRCLFFYEPGIEKDLVPNHYGMPSLLTLSPYRKRISEYKKGPSALLYFWPWSFSELKTMIEHSNKGKEPKHQLTFDAFWENFYLFGGIVRHHFLKATQKRRAKEDLEDRLLSMNLTVLQSRAVNIDRDDSGNNVSGYILCYDGKRQALEKMRSSDPEGRESSYFDSTDLRYTSIRVEEKADEILDKEPLVKKMQVVLDRLNKHAVDISGKNLEAVATEFLRAGTDIKWQVKRAGTGVWTAFQTKKRKVEKQYDIAKLLTKADVLLVPTNTSFPVADMVFSGWGQNNNVCVFQCTWQSSHPFTVRALYGLRVKHLKIAHEKMVFIIMVVPDQETAYSEMPEKNFLVGSINETLRYTESEIVQAEALQQMWSNTQVHILRPTQDWKLLISDWLDSS